MKNGDFFKKEKKSLPQRLNDQEGALSLVEGKGLSAGVLEGKKKKSQNFLYDHSGYSSDSKPDSQRGQYMFLLFLSSFLLGCFSKS